MAPAINDKDMVIVDRKAYINRYPERGDIIVFELSSNGKKKLICKRIIGLSNEKLEIKDGNVYINNDLTQINQLKYTPNYINAGDFGKKGQIITLPVNSYYLLGDNFSKSLDSRYFGPINKKDIYGKVVLTYSKNPPYKKIFQLLHNYRR